MPHLPSLWLPLCLLSVLPLAPTANAQLSVYGAGAIAGYGLKPANSSTFSFKSNAPGFLVGAFYNFPIDSRVTVGLDLRLAENPGTKGGTASAIAFRAGFVPHHVPLRPYFEIGGGVLSTSTNIELVNDQVRSGTYTSGAGIIAFGLDVPITRSIDIRALDIGSEASNSGAAVYADAGIVFHFRPR